MEFIRQEEQSLQDEEDDEDNYHSQKMVDLEEQDDFGEDISSSPAQDQEMDQNYEGRPSHSREQESPSMGEDLGDQIEEELELNMDSYAQQN